MCNKATFPRQQKRDFLSETTRNNNFSKKKIYWDETVNNNRKTMINMEYDWEANSRSKLETLEMEKKKRDQKPLYFCKLVAAYPLRSFRKSTLHCTILQNWFLMPPHR